MLALLAEGERGEVEEVLEVLVEVLEDCRRLLKGADNFAAAVGAPSPVPLHRCTSAPAPLLLHL